MGFSLQLEVENLTFSGSILMGCRQTFPGPEHTLKVCMAPLRCDSLVHFIVRELVCSLSNKGGQGGTGGYLLLTGSKKGSSHECKEVLRCEPDYRDGTKKG